MARRSQCSLAGDNPLDPNYLPPHYREEYRLAIDALVEEDLEGYYQFLQKADVVDFLCTPEIQHIQSSIHVPQQSTHHPERRFLEVGADGSSDTYWPLHSDLDAPGLDLGWPQLHHFIGPTEVTTLVNPPEPDMPSIKDQARRLIKNAQQVIAIAMDMFTDVDMFADILNAAMRNVAVYVILDEQNAHHFVDMVSNCRVNLQSIQYLRVRTVHGITYQCRSGKSFKGQMMDRFLLTDCRAVLSGNYSFMWSYEKLHRCMAHLFLGQLVSTFDEEFRILYAQSQPLIIDNMLGPTQDLGLPQKRPYLSKMTSHYRDPKKLLETGHPDESVRQSFDEGDWRMMPHKRQDQMRGPANIYNRLPSQQLRMDPSFDQGLSKMENPAFKRHSYAEGVPGRYSSQFLQPQGMPDLESQGWHFQRGQPPYPGPGRESDYSSYDKFWNQDYLSTDQYPETSLAQGMDSPDGFDPVLNYLSSSRPQDYDQGSEKMLEPDLPFGSPHPRRLSLGQPYACQTSPTSSNTTEQKLYLQESNADRKDPAVKRGLRNWRISSYLSAYENPEDEGLPMAMPQTADPFEEHSNPVQQKAPAVDFSLPKIPNVREFKVPAVPRASQMPSYAKTMGQEQPKMMPDEPVSVVTNTKPTPTPSDSSSATEGEKIEEAEPRPSALRVEDSFRRKYNAAQPRSSRLRSSLIFTSLDQQNTSEDQQDEGSDKGESEQTKLPFLSHLLGTKRSSTREPIEWSRFMKSATFDHSSTEASKPGDDETKPDDKEEDVPKKDVLEIPKAQEPAVPQSKLSESEQPKNDQVSQPPMSSVTPPLFLDMNDPDARLMFFKELAAKRKAAKAAEDAQAEKSKEKPAVQKTTDPKEDTAVNNEDPAPKQPTEEETSTPEGLLDKGGSAESVEKICPLKKEESVPKGSKEDMASTSEGSSEKLGIAVSAGKPAHTEPLKSGQPSPKADEQVRNSDSCVSDVPKSSKTGDIKVLADSGTTGMESSATVPPGKDTPHSESLEQQDQSKPAVKEVAPCHPPTQTNSSPPNVSALTQGTDKGESPRMDSTSKECHSVTPSSMKEMPWSAKDSNPPKSAATQSAVCPPPLQSEQDATTEASSSPAVAAIASSDHSSSTDSSPKGTVPSNTTTKDSILSPAHSPVLSDVAAPKEQKSGSSSPSAEEMSEKSENLSMSGKEQHITNLKTDKDISEPDKIELDLGKDITGSENQETEADKGISESEKPISLSENDSSSSKETLGSEKDDSPSGNNVSETADVSGSEIVVSDPAKDVSESESSSFQNSEVHRSAENNKALDTSPALSPFVCDSDLPMVENSASKPGLKEISPPVPTPVNTQAETSETSVKTDTSLSETTTSSQDSSKQTPPTSNLNTTVFDTPSSTETVSNLPPSESDSTSEAKTTKNTSAVQSSSDTKTAANETATNASNASQHATTETVSSPTEPTTNVPTEVSLPCKTPEPVTTDSHTSDSKVPADNKTEPDLLDTDEQKSLDTKSTSEVNEGDTQESANSEQTSDQVKLNTPEAAEVTAKQAKPNQSRYHSSTANVLSSSNLRDDTKLLLEQISANSQTRSETTKESPVTDDEKEDEADKNAKRELERGIRTLNKGQPKSAPEREKLLERIQCMRKERKVYSRFEV